MIKTLISVMCDKDMTNLPIEVATNFKTKWEAENYIKDNNLRTDEYFVLVDDEFEG